MIWSCNLGIGVGAGLLSLLIPVSAASGQPITLNQEKVQKRVEKSLVYLRFWRDGAGNDKGSDLAGQGTGFVITDPNKRKWIATASHGFWTTDARKRVASVTYRLPKEKDFYACGTILLDEKHDLAMLSPNRAAPLNNTLALDWGTTDPKDGDLLLVVGSPSGLEFTPYS